MTMANDQELNELRVKSNHVGKTSPCTRQMFIHLHHQQERILLLDHFLVLARSH